MNFQKFIFLLLFVSILFSGCTTHYKFDISYPEVEGFWILKDTSKGSLVLSFSRDMTYGVDYNNDGKADITGRYEVFEERVKFTDNNPRKETDCYEPGLHYYKITGDVLEFKPFAEQCRPRKFVLNLPFVRVNNLYKK